MQTPAAQTAEGCGDTRGTLPACAPLANPYVPFQGQNPERYTACLLYTTDAADEL